MSKNFGNMKGVQNYKLFLDKLKVGLLNQMLTSRNIGGKSSKWIEQSNAVKAAIQLMTKFLGQQSSPIFAQKLFRTYHITQLHSKLWSQRLLVKFGEPSLFQVYSSDEEGGAPNEGGVPPGVFRNEHYVPTSILQKSLLAIGSGLSSFLDPTRAESIATFGEVTAEIRLGAIHQTMLRDPEGARILRDKPRINSKSIDLDYLATLPEGTFGWAYIEFLRRNNVTPDSRLPVRFIENPEQAYVMQRYREVHDLIHTVTGMPTNMLGEVVVKWIEGIQTGLPMCVTGGLFGATRLRPKQRSQYINTHLPWAIKVGLNSRPLLNIYYEQRWEEPLHELRNYICPLLNTPPPSK